MKKRNPEEELRDVSWTAMMGLLGGRLAMISGFLIVLSFVIRQDNVAFYAFIAFAYIVTIPYSLWMRNQNRMRRLAPLQFLVDLVFVSGLIYFSGNMKNDFLILLYPLIILSAGIILPLKQTIEITALSILSYAIIVAVMSQNLLARNPAAIADQNLSDTVGAIALRISLFVFFGIASAYVSRRCDYINKKEKQFRTITKLVFTNVKTGLLLLDTNDRILIANDRACVLLGRDETDLIGKSLSSIHLKPSEVPSIAPDLRGAADYFHRADGSVFPVSIEDAQLTLPAEAALQKWAPAKDLIKARILNFNDLSHFMRMQSQIHQLERIKAASNMAKEMAHQIRTPLTAISGNIQLLQHQFKSFSEKGSAAATEQEELCRQIILESVRLDKVIQNFLDYAEFSPGDVRELINMNIDPPE